MRLTLLQSQDLHVVSVQQVKAHLRLDDTGEESLIEHYIEVATNHMEVYLGKTLLKKTWQIIFDKANGEVQHLYLAQGPFLRMLEINSLLPNGTKTPLRRYSFENILKPALVCKPIYPVEVVYEAGYGSLPKDVPASLRHALLLLVSYFYENRSGEAALPEFIEKLLHPFRELRSIS